MVRLTKNDLEEILNSLEEGVIISDANRLILFINSGAEKITGHRSNKVVGRYCYDVFNSNHCHSDCKLLKALEEEREILAPEVILEKAKGGKVPIRGRTFPFKSGDDFKGVIHIFTDISEIVSLRKQLDQHYAHPNFITKCPQMLEVMAIMPELSKSDVIILITGETGTGKEILAQSIHYESDRKDAPFVRVNCGALPDNLLEAELFGNVAGAYTDSKKARKGRLEMAEGGTIFLDEIGDMTPGMQVKFLRVIQEKTYEPLGSSTTKRADVRFISATHQELPKMVEEGKFREDLFYRINTMIINIPPLRDRLEDIPLLVNHFLKKYNFLTGKDIRSVHTRVMDVFMDAPWPGNVRQLEHAIEHAFVLANGDEIQLNHLPRDLRVNYSELREAFPDKSSLSTNLHLTQKEIIISCLKKHNWNKVSASQELGVSRSTLWRKMKTLQIPISQ